MTNKKAPVPDDEQKGTGTGNNNSNNNNGNSRFLTRSTPLRVRNDNKTATAREQR
jgi:hypothetical protein